MWPELTPERREGYIQRVMEHGGMFREQAIDRLTGHLCPHCGSSDMDRGATGLDMCNVCGGLSRGGRSATESKETS